MASDKNNVSIAARLRHETVLALYKSLAWTRRLLSFSSHLRLNGGDA
jgi:hypothetical protein